MNYDVVYTAGIQKAINEKANQRLIPDGQFGPMSISALQVCQQVIGVPVTGVYDDATFAILDPYIRQKFLTMDSITQAASTLGVTPAHIRAVCAVESNGAGFLPDGRIKILFERHWFLHELTARFPADEVTNWQVQNPDIISSTPGGYIGGVGEYSRFQRALNIDQYCAYYATSYGLFQTMGFNYQWAGYQDPMSLYTAFSQSETNQLLGFVSFIQKYQGGVLWTALNNQDWAGFALHYNGSNYAQNQYDVRLSNKFNTYTANINAT